jgi:predicted transcriptional regulator
VYAEFSSSRYLGVVYPLNPVFDQGMTKADRLNAEGTYFGAWVDLPKTPGTYTRSLWAGDTGRPEQRFDFTWTVLPDPVAASITRIVPTTGTLEITEGDALGLQAVGAIPDPAHTTYTWAIDGETISHSAVASAPHLAPGTHTVTVTAVAPGGSSTSSAPIHVAPRGTSVAPVRSNPWPLWLGIAGLVVVGIVLGGTEVGIYFLLAGLVGAIVDRQNREKLLTHFVRGRIYQIIDDEPGIHLSELQRKAGVARGVCAYHLHALEKAGLIKTTREGMYLKFFATKVKIDAEAYTLAADDRAVLEAIEARPGITEQQVAEILGKPSGHVARSVRALSQSGYVEARREGGATGLFARTQRGSGSAPPASGV